MKKGFTGIPWNPRPQQTSGSNRGDEEGRHFGNNSRLWATTSSSSSSSSSAEDDDVRNVDINTRYIQGLLENLTGYLDRWILNGSPRLRAQAINVVKQIEAESVDNALVQQAYRQMQRAGIKLEPTNKELGKTDGEKRQEEAQNRKKWETFRANVEELGKHVGRETFTPSDESSGLNELILKAIENKMAMEAQSKSSRLVALSGAAFEGETLGIGGLDDVLAEVKRRVWVPLAAPPKLLLELGISPVRGLLLYGRPGCGKTLLAGTIGRILSPARPITVVSGPEIMDKFVGTSEKNLRALFENPPPIYEEFLDGKESESIMSKASLHVIILDEFDAIARARGGMGGKGNQGDAGVARDSVVNQLLAKMDGVDPLPAPTLVIGMTNKRSLIEPALLRPGRFEVQIEVPPPRTKEQRKSILKVHTKNMYEAGKLLVSDAPASLQQDKGGLMSYDELLDHLSDECSDMSGASLAAVARAAASRALERAMVEYSKKLAYDDEASSSLECFVTQEDFGSAVEDVIASSGNWDWNDDEKDDVEDDEEDDNDSQLQ